MKTFIVFLGVWILVSCTPSTQSENKFASLPFDVTGSREAMPSFQKGLLLLHNFEYDDAADAFLEAQKIDSAFLMAYWGEAMTYNHPIWGSLDLDQAKKALRKLGPSPEARVAKAKSELEGDFLKAIEILYGEGSKPDRDKNYSDYMETMYEHYPGNHEVAAFYALSLLSLKTGWSKWEDVNKKAAAISEAILKENPEHPGALHYLIHSDDHPEHAKFALAAANDYAKVASYAGHALHMPSHIYLALGMWDDVVKSNEVAWQAGVDRMNAKGLTNDDLNYHAHIWLEYGYLQQGRFDEARELVEDQLRFTTEVPSAQARFTLQQMKGYYLFETDEWSDDIAKLKIKTDDLSLMIRSVGHLIDGVTAFHQKDAATLSAVIQVLETDLARATALKNDNENTVICGLKAFVDKIPSEGDLKVAAFVGLELRAMQSWMQGDAIKAEKFFREAVEKGNAYLYGPPNIIKPVQELFGEFLLTENRPQEALDQFEQALKWAPNRRRSLQGALEAAGQMNNVKKTAELEKKLSEINGEGVNSEGDSAGDNPH